MTLIRRSRLATLSLRQRRGEAGLETTLLQAGDKPLSLRHPRACHEDSAFFFSIPSNRVKSLPEVRRSLGPHDEREDDEIERGRGNGEAAPKMTAEITRMALNPGQVFVKRAVRSILFDLRRCVAHKFLMRQLLYLLLLIPALSPACATEYDLSAYLAEPQTIAAAIGSNDAALKARMEGLTDYVAANGLEERFDPAGQWRLAVADLVAGRPRANEFINGFALEILFLSVADRASPPNMGAPFADLETASNYLRYRGFVRLADFMDLINNGNTAGAQDRLPPALKGRLGETDYPARVSVITAADAAALLALLPQIGQASQELDELAQGEESSGAARARLAIEKAETARWSEFYKQENNRDELGGMTVEQSIASAVARTLEDPYIYSDPLSELNGSLKTLEAWLGRAVRTGRAVFFVYETN
jgi:hypothetical protein